MKPLIEIKTSEKTIQRRVWPRILRFVRAIDWSKNPSVNLRVMYGNDFENEGVYKNQTDFLLALEAFVEDSHILPPDLKKVLNDGI